MYLLLSRNLKTQFKKMVQIHWRIKYIETQIDFLDNDSSQSLPKTLLAGRVAASVPSSRS